MSGKILVVDDDKAMCELIEAALSKRGFEILWSTDADRGLDILRKHDVDAVLTDLKMPKIGGIELCERAAADWPELPVVVITAFGSLDSAVAAIRAGAYDFVTKPLDMDLLALVLDRAVNHHRLQAKVRVLNEALHETARFESLIGESAAMRNLSEVLNRIAGTDASVLIMGESGTGKELVARALHERSPRGSEAYIAVNCANLPATLLESELFGHAKGAFTDARAARKGLFQQAHKGTLFLDEIAEIPLELQPKLLRVLEERRVRAVGSDVEVECDVRLIAATNRDIERAVEEGKFREDLYFRVNVIPVHVPPLRDRDTDVLLLAQHFIEQYAARYGKNVIGLSESAAEKLLNYEWPGNVRELRNAMERAVTLTRHERLVVEDLPEKLHERTAAYAPNGAESSDALLTMRQVEQRHLLHVLDAVNWNKSKAARVLGVSRKTLYTKLSEYGIEQPK